MYTDKEKQNITRDMSNKIYNDQYEVTEQELIKDPTWAEATKKAYKHLEGTDFAGSDEDLAKEGLSMMSKFNYNLVNGTINYTSKMESADDETKLAFYYMMDTYDKKDISAAGVGRAFKQMGLDPSTYIGIGTLGMGFAGKEAAGYAAKTGIKAILKKGAMNYLKNTTAVAATEGAIYGGVDDYERQKNAVGAGVQEEVNPKEVALASTIGAVAGGGLVEGGKAIGKGVKKMMSKDTKYVGGDVIDAINKDKMEVATNVR